MKNKIVCLFNKIIPDYLVCVIGFAMLFLLVFIMVVAPLSASAAEEGVLGLRKFNDTLTIDSEFYAEYDVEFTTTFVSEEDNINSSLTCNQMIIGGSNAPDNDFQLPFMFYVVTNSNPELSDDEIFNGLCWAYLEEFPIASLQTINVISCEDENAKAWLLANTVAVDDGAHTCPTLSEQIADYTGTWSDLENIILDSGNTELKQGLLQQYRDYEEAAYELGQDSVTLADRLAGYSGTWAEFAGKLETDNPILFNSYLEHINDVNKLGYDNGYSLGYDEGHTEGYALGHNDGYNLAASKSFGENLLGDLLNAPLKAMNSWVLYESPNGVTVTMGGVFGAFVALSVLLAFLKMFSGG